MPEGFARSRGRRDDPTVPSRVIALFALTVALLALLPGVSSAQITWLNFEDGDVLNVSKASGLEPGHVRIDLIRSLEDSDVHGQILSHHFNFLYGLTPRITLGASSRFLDQRNGDLFKSGMGDSNVFLKAHWNLGTSPFSLGLRQSLTLPTGYELERPGLVPFTTTHNDYAVQALVSYRTRRLGIHLNPGVIVTGGDNPTYLTAGGALELERFLPLGLNLAGEYFTRWNMVAEKFESDVFLRFDRALFWGLSADVGVKRRLLESSTTRAEWRFGLSLGRVHDRDADSRYLPPPRFAPVRLSLDPVGSEIPDPTGVAAQLYEELRMTGYLQSHGVPVLIRAGDEVTAGSEDPLRGYRLQLRVLNLEDGRVGGFRVPMLIEAPRAEAEMHVLVRLLDRNGLPLGREVVFDARVSQGLGTVLAPMTTSYERKIVPDEIRTHLRQRVVEKLARDIAEVNAEVIGSRESR